MGIYIQQYQPKVSKRYLENFHLYMGKQFSKPPPPQPKKWLDQCMKTAIPNIGWKPADWFDKIKLEQNPQKGWLTIDKCMPPFMWVVQFNTNFLEKKNSQHFFSQTIKRRFQLFFPFFVSFFLFLFFSFSSFSFLFTYFISFPFLFLSSTLKKSSRKKERNLKKGKKT